MSHNVGRHRAPGRYNPATEIGQIITEAGTPLAKGSAVLAASGGLVAAIAIPAQASPLDTTEPTPQAASALQASGSERAVVALEQTAAVTAPAAKSSKKAATSFGKVGVEPVAKPTGPTEAELRERAEREAAERQAAQEAAAEQAADEQAADEQQATQEQTEERQESAPSRSQERQAPAQSSSSGSSAPAPAPAPSSGGVIGIAKQYIGTPYVYGGTSPSGFDCSGFTQYVFGKAGVSLPRTTTAQQAATTPVSDPQPGDLVFFGSPAYHMGIYLGDGMMIDAPSSGKSVSIRPVFSGVSGYGRV
ncbi:C40 family peptidase [Janibacter alittae]|uniref:C40 family peptidase n=1 Tax=Janibacter alittae TaxID=3115209 RepID=A0ABZ2MIB5_9MICO